MQDNQRLPRPPPAAARRASDAQLSSLQPGRRRGNEPGFLARAARAALNILVLVLVMKGSVPVVKNMAMPDRGQQVMNTSFDR